MEKDQAVRARDALPIVAETEAAPLAQWLANLLAQTRKAVDTAAALVQDGATVDRPPGSLVAELEKLKAVVRHNGLLLRRVTQLRAGAWPEEMRDDAGLALKELGRLAAMVDICRKQMLDLVAEQSTSDFTAPKL